MLYNLAFVSVVTVANVSRNSVDNGSVNMSYVSLNNLASIYGVHNTQCLQILTRSFHLSSKVNVCI